MNVNQTIRKLFSRAAMMLLATILLSMTAQPAQAGNYLYLVQDNSTTATIKCSERIPDGYSLYNNPSDVYKGYDNYPNNNWDEGKSDYKTVNIDVSCQNYTGNLLSNLFNGFNNVEVINGLENLRTDDVTRINNMFEGCSKLKSVDVSSFNMEKVECMECMFYSCSSLTMLDLGAWNTPNLVRMEDMFTNCTNLNTIYVGTGWNTDKVRFEWGSGVFTGCTNLVGGKGTQCQGTEEQHMANDHNYINADGLNGKNGYLTGDWTIFNTGDDADHAYVIDSKSLLDLLSHRVNAGNTYQGKYFKLGADITYDKSKENNFTPIGIDVRLFSGTFDGNGKTISGININNSTGEYQGIFGFLYGTVKNLVVSDCSILAYKGIGAIVGYLLSGTIENCHVGNDVTLRGSLYVGGIASVSEVGTIKGCTSAATITGVIVDGAQWLGGIVGAIFPSESPSILTDNLFTGTINGDLDDYIGAIVGNNDNSTLTNNVYTSTGFGGIGAAGSTTGADGDGARRAYAVTLGDGVSMGETGTAYGTVTNDGDFAITPFANNPGLIYTTKSGGTVTNTTYVGATETVTLSYTGDLADGYAAGYKVNDGEATVGNTITMPAADATITATTVDVWGMANGADGTSDAKAYTITTTAGLDLLAKKVNAGNDYYNMYFKLGADITYTHKADGEEGADTENNYTAIGNYSKYFAGHFDGKGYTISGIRIYKGGTDYSTNGYQGLFGSIGNSSAEVKNITLTDTRITAAAYAGGIAGKSSGTIANCHVTNTVKIQAINESVSDHGGIVGVNSGTVNGCISEATLTNVSGSHYGGIAGYSFGTLEDNFVIGATIPEATFNNHGAIVGYFPNGTLKNNYYTACTVAGTANATNVGVGESVGDMAGARRAVAIGTAEGVSITPTGEATTYNVSGITAYADNTVIGYDSKLYAGASDAVKLNISYAVEGYVATGYTDGNGHALTANNDGTYTLAMTATTPTITATVDDVWGMANGADGTSEAKAYTITTTAGLDLLAKKVNAGNWYSNTYFQLGADITYTHKADGEDGADTENNFTSIGNYYKSFDGHFDGNGKTISGIRIYKGGTDYSTDGYQGLFGEILSHAEVKNITLADTRITAASEAGGIAGASSGTIANCHITNTVKILAINESSDSHGGIVGWNTGGTVRGCISEATLTKVSGSVKYGGIVGDNIQGTLENNFVIGATIPGAKDNTHGAIVGQNYNGTLKNNYYTACTVAGTANATNVGVGVDSNYQSVGDVIENNGALSVYKITLTEGVTGVTIDTSVKVYSYDGKDYYDQGKQVKFTWTPATGYQFNGIDAGEGVTGTLSGNVYTITMPARDVVASVNVKKLLTNTDITVSEIAGQTCTGSEIKPAITVKDGTTDITGECDFAFADNKAVGTATVTITAKASSNAYAGETTTTFDILRQMKDLFADGNQWTGYVAEEDLDLPAGLTAYVITALGEASATATALNYIPKGEPVLLSRADKDVNLYLAPAGSGTAPTTNLLKVASTTVQPVAYQDYALYKDAFILYGGGTLASGKVFLALPQSSKSRSATRSIVIDGDDTTGMSEALSVESEESAGDWYDLQGRRLEGRPLKRGLYIHNGQKKVIK